MIYPVYPIAPESTNPVLHRCCSERQRAYDQYRDEGVDHFYSMVLGRRAFFRAAPLLDRPENVAEYIACVTYAISVDIIDIRDATKLLWAAQLAAVNFTRMAKASKSLESASDCQPRQVAPIPTEDDEFDESESDSEPESDSESTTATTAGAPEPALAPAEIPAIGPQSEPAPANGQLTSLSASAAAAPALRAKTPSRRSARRKTGRKTGQNTGRKPASLRVPGHLHTLYACIESAPVDSVSVGSARVGSARAETVSSPLTAASAPTATPTTLHQPFAPVGPTQPQNPPATRPETPTPPSTLHQSFASDRATHPQPIVTQPTNRLAWPHRPPRFSGTRPITTF